MSKKYAFLFPGQGAQEPGMLKEICEAFPEARKVVDEVSSISGLDMTKIMWESEKEVLSRSDNSQMAIMTASLATMKVLESKGITPSASMGFSLGEFPALYAAGVLSFEDVVKVDRVLDIEIKFCRVIMIQYIVEECLFFVSKSNFRLIQSIDDDFFDISDWLMLNVRVKVYRFQFWF